MAASLQRVARMLAQNQLKTGAIGALGMLLEQPRRSRQAASGCCP